MIGTEKIKSFQRKFICIVTDEAFFPEKKIAPEVNEQGIL